MSSVWTHPPLGALPSRALLLDELLSFVRNGLKQPLRLITWGAGVVFAAQALAQAVAGQIEIDHLAASTPTATIGCVLASKKPKPRHVFINDMHCCKHDTKGCSVELEGTIMLIECDTVEEQTRAVVSSTFLISTRPRTHHRFFIIDALCFRLTVCLALCSPQSYMCAHRLPSWTRFW